jgi:starch phosphorylase
VVRGIQWFKQVVCRGKGRRDLRRQDNQTANAIYELLEHRIVPPYYDRDGAGWVAMMKETIRSNTPFFNRVRMAKECTERFYLEALQPTKVKV